MRYRSGSNADWAYFYYDYNSRGDIVGLYDEDGSLECTYTYDAWGKLLSVKNPAGTEMTSATYIGNLQSLKYRGYVYDRETGLYYLQSRYYDPVTRRFINADGLVSTGTGVLGYNMFAYCVNNPALYFDPHGNYIIIPDDVPLINYVYYVDAIVYLARSSKGLDLIMKLLESKNRYTILFNDDFNTKFNPRTNEIHWDPTGGLALSNGKAIQSPALGLAHEFGHAALHLDYDDYYGNEEDVLRKYEGPIADELGEPKRRNYMDTDPVSPNRRMTNSTQFVYAWSPSFASKSGGGGFVVLQSFCLK